MPLQDSPYRKAASLNATLESTYRAVMDPTNDLDDRKAMAGMMVAYASQFAVEVSELAGDPHLDVANVGEMIRLVSQAWAMVDRAWQATGY